MRSSSKKSYPSTFEKRPWENCWIHGHFLKCSISSTPGPLAGPRAWKGQSLTKKSLKDCLVRTPPSYDWGVVGWSVWIDHEGCPKTPEMANSLLLHTEKFKESPSLSISFWMGSQAKGTLPRKRLCGTLLPVQGNINSKNVCLTQGWCQLHIVSSEDTENNNRDKKCLMLGSFTNFITLCATDQLSEKNGLWCHAATSFTG